MINGSYDDNGGFPGSSASKESACNAGDPGLISELGRSPGGGHGNPLQSSCLENFMDRGALRATVHGVAKSWTQLRDLYFLPSRKEQVAVPKKFLLEGELLFSLFCKLPEAFRALGTERPRMCL